MAVLPTQHRDRADRKAKKHQEGKRDRNATSAQRATPGKTRAETGGGGRRREKGRARVRQGQQRAAQPALSGGRRESEKGGIASPCKGPGVLGSLGKR